MARPFRNPARNPTFLALSSAELPAGYSSKNSKNNNDGRKEKAGASAILCDHDGAGFPRKTGDRSHLEDMALFLSSSLPIVSRAPSFFPLPSLPTTQRGLCACRGENSLRLYSAWVVSSLQDYRVSKRFHILPVPQRRQAEFTVKRCCSCQN